jgi:hypothetical protein
MRVFALQARAVLMTCSMAFLPCMGEPFRAKVVMRRMKFDFSFFRLRNCQTEHTVSQFHVLQHASAEINQYSCSAETYFETHLDGGLESIWQVKPFCSGRSLAGREPGQFVNVIGTLNPRETGSRRRKGGLTPSQADDHMCSLTEGRCDRRLLVSDTKWEVQNVGALSS